MAATAFDLTQVGKLFDDAVAAIRDGTPDMDALEPQALEWLKGARRKLMRELEETYYDLERTRNTPLAQPSWAIDPARKLSLSVGGVPAVLEPYRRAMGDNLHIATAAAPQVHRTLHVADEFSTQTNAFAVNPFARLIVKARASASDVTDSGGNIRHRRASKNKGREDAEKTFDSVPGPGIASAQSVVPAGKQRTGNLANSVAGGLQTAVAGSTAEQGVPDASTVPAHSAVPAEKQRTGNVAYSGADGLRTPAAVSSAEQGVPDATTRRSIVIECFKPFSIVSAEKQPSGNVADSVAVGLQTAALVSTAEQRVLDATTIPARSIVPAEKQPTGNLANVVADGLQTAVAVSTAEQGVPDTITVPALRVVPAEKQRTGHVAHGLRTAAAVSTDEIRSRKSKGTEQQKPSGDAIFWILFLLIMIDFWVDAKLDSHGRKYHRNT
ncbi:hypothetical protein B0H12DRAFT_1234006 [Mycena haematopus]|nr:hypothetical protein B0H12DRAFT_1234006 [Mycena haematopus]